MDPINIIKCVPSVNKPHYSLIILVIASHSYDYDMFAKQWYRYMNLFTNVRTFFLYSDPTIKPDILVECDKITYKFEEWFEPGILFKTIAGMHVCNNLFTYDYILRTNLSSFIHIPRLLTFLSSKPKTDYVAAKQDEFREGVWFLSGAGFIVSRDIVCDLLHHSTIKSPIDGQFTNGMETIPCEFIMHKNVKEAFENNGIDKDIKYAPDDVALTHLIKLAKKNIMFERLERYDCIELTDPITIENLNCFHVRNKTEWKYHNRDIDIKNMKIQVDNLLFSI